MPVRLFRAARAERINLRQLYRPSRPEPQPSASAAPPRILEAQRNQPAEPLRESPPSAPLVAPVKRVYEAANGREASRPVAASDLVKGYEYAKDQYVVLDEQELRSIAPKTSTEMQIVEFVRFSEIDPVYLETSYYVVPDETGERAYALLLQAMREAGYAAIGQITMHRRDHVMIVRAGNTGLIAHTMFYSDEVRTIDEFRSDLTMVAPKELELAKTLIQALAAPFDPAKFKNQFRDRLHQLIESRAAHREVTLLESPAPGNVIDIMDALKRSLAEVKSAEPARDAPHAIQRKPARAESSGKKHRAAKAHSKR